jgi:hypothetical protein
MLVSGLQSRSSLLTDLAPSLATSSVTGTGSYDNALGALFSSITSEDLGSAKKALTRVEQLAPSSSYSNSALDAFLSSVSSSLANDSLSGAQTALDTLKNYTASSAAEADGTVTPQSNNNNSSDASTSSLSQDVFNLATAIDTGDMSGARASYDSLSSSLSDGVCGFSSSETDFDMSDGYSITSQLQGIQSALDTNNVSTARMALDTFLTSLSAGSLVNVKA